MASYKFKFAVVDLELDGPDKESQFYTLVQMQVLLNQMVTNKTYIKHRVTSVGERYLHYEILVKPEK